MKTESVPIERITSCREGTPCKNVACTRLPDSREREKNCVRKTSGARAWVACFSHAVFLFPDYLGSWHRLVKTKCAGPFFQWGAKT